MAFDDQRKTWFLAQLKPNCAAIAEKNLRRQGFSTFLPLEEETRSRSGRFVTALRPLFPGYIFVAFETTGTAWRSVNSTHGITRLVSFGRDPAAVPGDLVSQLMARCDAGGRLHAPEALKAGDRVRVTRGPFADTLAKILSVTPDRRVWLLMELMGGETRVAVDAGQLRPV